MRSRQKLLTVAEKFAEATGLSLATIGKYTSRNNAMLPKLATGRGKGPSIDTYDDAMEWMSDHWPEGAEWPSGIDRPSRKAAA